MKAIKVLIERIEQLALENAGLHSQLSEISEINRRLGERYKELEKLLDYQKNENIEMNETIIKQANEINRLKTPLMIGLDLADRNVR